MIYELFGNCCFLHLLEYKLSVSRVTEKRALGKCCRNFSPFLGKLLDNFFVTKHRKQVLFYECSVCSKYTSKISRSNKECLSTGIAGISRVSFL